MIKLIQVEFLKLRTQRALRVYIIVVFAMTLLTLLPFLLGGGPFLGTEAAQRRLIGTQSWAPILVILAVLVGASEYRHKTITWSLLGVPDRNRILTAKLILLLVIGLGYGLVVGLMAVVGVKAQLLSEGVPWLLSWNEVLSGYGRDLIAGTLYIGFGFGLATLLVNQVAAIAVVLFGEPALSQIVTASVPEIGRFLPATAAAALQGDMMSVDQPLSPNLAGIVFLSYSLILLLLAYRITHRRDFT